MQTIQEQIAGVQDAIARLETVHKTANTTRKRQITSLIKTYKKTLAYLQNQEQQ